MPNRIIRDGILTSERLAKLSAGAEVCFYRLLVCADDWGRFHAHPAILRAALFPLKIDVVTEGELLGWLKEITKAELVTNYTANGKKYLQIATFNQRTRAKCSKFPDPPAQDGHVAVMPRTIARVPRTEADTYSETHSQSKAGEAPTVEQVIDFGNEGAAIPKFYCEDFWDWHEENGAWTTPAGNLKQWRKTLVRWFISDGRPKTKQEKKRNGKEHKANNGRGFDRNAGTANEGKAAQYAGLGKIV
tara:strand:+ start:365 stop:1102 length:738 start_codon:yes stop_codon:yes gene_type:complete